VVVDYAHSPMPWSRLLLTLKDVHAPWGRSCAVRLRRRARPRQRDLMGAVPSRHGRRDRAPATPRGEHPADHRRSGGRREHSLRVRSWTAAWRSCAQFASRRARCGVSRARYGNYQEIAGETACVLGRRSGERSGWRAGAVSAMRRLSRRRAPLRGMCREDVAVRFGVTDTRTLRRVRCSSRCTATLDGHTFLVEARRARRRARW